MRAQDLVLPVDWSDAVPLQVSDVIMTHIASKRNL